MTQEPSRETMLQLRAELTEMQTDDGYTRKVIDDMIEGIDDWLAESEAEHRHQTLGERINAAIAHFETDHPNLTAALNTAARILGTGGV